MGLCLGRRELGWLFAGSLLLSCGKAEKHRPNGGLPDQALDAKAALYSQLLPSVQDEDGFVETDTCDSVHWSALVGAIADTVNVRAAIDDFGKLHRRPARYPECYPEFSKSENSRDAYLMVLVYALTRHDLDLVEGIFAYGKAQGWVMGKGPLSRTYFTPSMQALYAQAVEHLGGEANPERLYPVVWNGLQTGYAAHLEVISVLAYGQIHGWIPDAGISALKAHHERQPRNPLFAAAYYRYTGDEIARDAAATTLMDEHLFPEGRLPTSADRCESWLVQRDEGSDWEPCDQGRTHSGGDYLFTHAVLSGRL